MGKDMIRCYSLTKPIICWLIGITTLVLALEIALINCCNKVPTHGEFTEKLKFQDGKKLVNYRAIFSVLIEQFSQNMGGMTHAVPHLHKQFFANPSATPNVSSKATPSVDFCSLCWICKTRYEQTQLPLLSSQEHNFTCFPQEKDRALTSAPNWG